MGVKEKLERLSYQAKCKDQKMVSALLHTMSLLVTEDDGDNLPDDPVERYEDELCATSRGVARRQRRTRWVLLG